MSTNAPSVEPEIEDFDHDEPTQFMLQLMQTSAQRRRKGKTENVFSKFRIGKYIAPFLSLVYLVLVPIIAFIYTIYNLSSYFSNILTLFSETMLLINLIWAFLVFFTYFVTLLVPINRKGKLLDIFQRDTYILSGILGTNRWKYMIRKREIDPAVQKLKLFLCYSLLPPTLSITITEALPIMFREVWLLILISIIIIVYILFYAALSLLINTYRSVISLKIMIYQAYLPVSAQIAIVLIWISWWNIIGFVFKYNFIINDVYLRSGYRHIKTLTAFNISVCYFVLILITAALTVSLLLKIFKYFLSLKLIKSFKYVTKLLFEMRSSIFILSVGIFFLIHWTLTIIHVLISKHSLDFQNVVYIIGLITILIISIKSSSLLESKKVIDKLVPMHIFIFLIISLLVAAVFIILKLQNPHISENPFYAVLVNLSSVLISTPSIWPITDVFILNSIEVLTDKNLNFNIIIYCYLSIVFLPSLFARFMENIALQKPVTPKI